MSELVDFLLARIAEDERGTDDFHDAYRCAVVDLVNDSIGGWCTCGHPARLLAECEAKRQLIALDARGYDMEPAMMYLAAIYAGHPDYRQEWKP